MFSSINRGLQLILFSALPARRSWQKGEQEFIEGCGGHAGGSTDHTVMNSLLLFGLSSTYNIPQAH